MNKREAERRAREIEKTESGSTCTVFRHEVSGWVIEYRPAPRTDNDGNRWEQPTRIIFA